MIASVTLFILEWPHSVAPPSPLVLLPYFTPASSSTANIGTSDSSDSTQRNSPNGGGSGGGGPESMIAFPSLSTGDDDPDQPRKIRR